MKNPPRLSPDPNRPLDILDRPIAPEGSHFGAVGQQDLDIQHEEENRVASIDDASDDDERDIETGRERGGSGQVDNR